MKSIMSIHGDFLGKHQPGRIWSWVGAILMSHIPGLGVAEEVPEPPAQPGSSVIVEPSSQAKVDNPAAQPVWFDEQARALGIDFVHFNGMSGEFYFLENVGGGAALFDYDNDGDLDLYLVQGHMLGEDKTLQDALFPPPAGTRLIDRLYRNDLQVLPNGTRRLRFTDVTEQAKLEAPGYGMGVTVGDYNNDGWVDLYVTNYKRNQLWKNNGDGTFREVTEQASVPAPQWTVSAAFVDYDRDGWLDLYAANYVHFDLNNNAECHAPSGARDYCSPQYFDAVSDFLFHNKGNGTFENVSEDAGITAAKEPGLGVVVADFNQDQWPDIYVANDGSANQLWMNQKNGTFVDDAFLAGTAVNMDGAAEASMGVDAGDFDEDGDEDLFMTHLFGETNTLYINNGEGWFEDRSLSTGLAMPSKAFTAFGTAWFDYDNDGWLDIFVANGGVRSVAILAYKGDAYPLHQPNQLFANLGNGQFKEVTAQAGPVFKLSEVSRGAAFGDLDNDGDTDIVIANNNGPARVLINQVGNRNHWLGLRLVDRHGRDALGARVVVRRDKEERLWRRVRVDGSYASANDPRVLIGLGQAPDFQKVRVYWPDGKVEEWTELHVDQYSTLHEGEGRAVDKP